MRVLVQVQPDRTEEVRKSLIGMGLKVIMKAFDYLVIDIPPEIVGKVRTIPYVIDIVPEERVDVFVNLFDLLPALPSEGLPIPRFMIKEIEVIEPLPVEKKLKIFLELLKNPLTAHKAFAFASAETKDRWPTGESRKLLGADIAEAEGIKGKGVKVAVIDTGFAPTWQGHYFSPENKSSVEGQPIPWDENGHSMHCATIINGKEFKTPFGILKGVAPECEVGIFKALGYLAGTGTNSSVLRAMMDAFEWRADIMSLSLGAKRCIGCERCPTCRAVKAMADQGIIVVVANGNDGEGTQGCPACSPYAISVGAIDKHGKIAKFSSRGKVQGKPDVVAPGVYITSSATGLIALMQLGRDFPGTATISGTSMATPHISGLMALWKHYLSLKGINLTPQIAKDIIRRYGRPWTPDYGFGVPHFNWVKRYVERR